MYGQWRHEKSGEVYTISGFGLIEATLEPSVIYESKSGQVWIRPATEFFDGRFKQVHKVVKRQSDLVTGPSQQ